MYSPPDSTTAARMRSAHQNAAEALGVVCGDGEFWGWAGRTLGRPGTGADGRRVWLRLITAPEEKASGKLWEGTEAAQEAFADLGGHRPQLLAVHETVADGVAHRAELSEHVDAAVISADPVLRGPVHLPADWWSGLRDVLRTVAEADTERVAVRRAYLDRAVPQYLGVEVPDRIRWTPAHGDLHWANLTMPLGILDWEGWGEAPYGYDAATLYAYSLAEPDMAARVREAFPELGTPATWAGEAAIVAELLQTTARGDNQALIDPLEVWARRLRRSAQHVSSSCRAH
ncbi:phosphotransferase [Streptomyces mobaraensis]|uniref:phosphotransferase n=1 Tax=Streptomyces mobaraensis TaxID=35621 RepID=UPI00332D542C